MPTTQLSSNNLKERKIGLGDVQLFVLNTFLVIKPFYLHPGLGRLFLERISQIEIAERSRAQQVLELS